MSMWKRIGMAAGILALVAFGYLPWGAAQEGKSIDQMIAEAKTPADHEAIAAYYENEAQKAHQEHAEHLKRRDSYATIPVLKTKTGAVDHCNTIAKKYADIAKEDEALAKLHHDLAKTAK
jgi:hypothetical protein